MARGADVRVSAAFIPVNDLRAGWIATDGAVHDAVRRVLERGWYIRGPEHDAFEVELAAFLGAEHAIGLASGTDALTLALLAVGGEHGAEIVTAANAGAYTSVAAAIVGAAVVYADVDARSLVVTPETVMAAVGPSTRAVVVTHLYGNIADTAGIRAVCEPRGIVVIEDCAQAIGGVRDGRRAGTVGDVAAFSFYPTKNLGAAGDGGAIVTNDAAIAERVKRLRQYGWAERYRIVEGGGRNSRLDEVQAAILRIGLRRVDALNDRRRAIAERYADAASGPVRAVTGAGLPTVAHLAVVRAMNRDRLRDCLSAAQIGTDVHYPIADHHQPGLPAAARPTALPVTERAQHEILTLPCFPTMTDEDVERVCRVLSEVSVA